MLGPIFLIVINLCAFETRINWIININILTWSRIWSFYFLINWSCITAIESCMNCFFLNNSIFYIVFFLLVIILTRSWIFSKCLSRIWRFAFMFPKLSSLCLWKKTLRFLSYKNAIWIVSCMVLSLLLNWYNCFICTWTWWQCSFLFVFAVRHFRLKHFILSRWIELLLTCFFIVIYTRTWILCPTHVVVSHVRLLEKLSIYFAWSEIIFREPWMDGWYFWIISCWTDLIKTNSSIRSLC